MSLKAFNSNFIIYYNFYVHSVRRWKIHSGRKVNIDFIINYDLKYRFHKRSEKFVYFRSSH